MRRMIRVLILEDDEERIQVLKKKMKHFNISKKDVEIIWKTEAERFEAWVAGNKENPPDLIILDHDLDYWHYVDSGPGGYCSNNCAIPPTGADAAKCIEWKDVPVVIWSMNPPGANNIEKILNEKNIASAKIPFSTECAIKVCKMIQALLVDG